jgi:hypothetical protein
MFGCKLFLRDYLTFPSNIRWHGSNWFFAFLSNLHICVLVLAPVPSVDHRRLTVAGIPF